MSGDTDRTGLMPCGCKVALVVSVEEPRARVDWCKLHGAAERLLDLVIWMSGASDFGGNGQAHAAWVRNRKLVFDVLQHCQTSKAAGPGPGGTRGL